MSRDIQRYLNIRSAYGVSFGPEGDRLGFLLDTTGVPQVWSLASLGGWPTQHTIFKERVTFVSWSPERREFVFGMDDGGNERAQFHRYDLDSGRGHEPHRDPRRQTPVGRVESRRRALCVHLEPPRPASRRIILDEEALLDTATSPHSSRKVASISRCCHAVSGLAKDGCWYILPISI